MVLVPLMALALVSLESDEKIKLRGDGVARIQFTERELLLLHQMLEEYLASEPAFYSLVGKVKRAIGRILCAKCSN